MFSKHSWFLQLTNSLERQDFLAYWHKRKKGFSTKASMCSTGLLDNPDLDAIENMWGIVKRNCADIDQQQRSSWNSPYKSAGAELHLKIASNFREESKMSSKFGVLQQNINLYNVVTEYICLIYIYILYLYIIEHCLSNIKIHFLTCFCVFIKIYFWE